MKSHLKRIGLLPAIGLIGWFISTTFLDWQQNRRLDALEHATVTVSNVLQPVVIQNPDGITEIHTFKPTNLTVRLEVPK